MDVELRRDGNEADPELYRLRPRVVQRRRRCDHGQRHDREHQCGGDDRVGQLARREQGRRRGRPRAYPGHEQQDARGEQHVGGKGGHQQAEEARVVEGGEHVRPLQEQVRDEPRADEQESAERPEQQRRQSGERQPLDHACDPEVLAEAEHDLMQVAPAVQLRTVQAVEQAAARQPHRFRGCRRQLPEPAVLPEREREQRRREPGGERQGLAPAHGEDQTRREPGGRARSTA